MGQGGPINDIPHYLDTQLHHPGNYRPIATLPFSHVIPEIDIWRAANLMLKRYGDKAIEESAARADELAAQDDYNGAAVWRRITDAVGQLANDTPPAPLH